MCAILKRFRQFVRPFAGLPAGTEGTYGRISEIRAKLGSSSDAHAPILINKMRTSWRRIRSILFDKFTCTFNEIITRTNAKNFPLWNRQTRICIFNNVNQLRVNSNTSWISWNVDRDRQINFMATVGAICEFLFIESVWKSLKMPTDVDRKDMQKGQIR